MDTQEDYNGAWMNTQDDYNGASMDTQDDHNGACGGQSNGEEIQDVKDNATTECTPQGLWPDSGKSKV